MKGTPSIVIGRLSQRLSTRVAAATSALALFFVVCMGVGAWLVASGMMHGQAERQMDEIVRARAAHVADLLTIVATHVQSHAKDGDGAAARAVVADMDLTVRRVKLDDLPDWNRAATILGVGAGRLSAEEGGWIEMMLPIGNHGVLPTEALLWRLPLEQLARRLDRAGGGVGGDLTIRVGGERAQVNWGAPLSANAVLGESEVMLPNGFGRGQLLLSAGVEAGGADLPLGKFALWLSLIGLIATALAVALATVTSRRLTRTLSGLADAATSYAFDAGGPVNFHVHGNDEIARLGKAFAGMVERLDQAYRDLDQRSQASLSNAERVARVGSAIWIPGENRHIWSEQFLAILGLSSADVIPSREVLFDRVHPDDRGGLAQVLADAMSGGEGRVVAEFRIIRGDGVERVAQFRAEVARDGQGHPVRLDATIQDITESKRMEEQLDGVVRELKRSNEELEQFAYVASHDLRQPLRTVRSYLTLIEDAIEDKLDDETREFMDFIRDGVKRMDALITDLLAYSRVGRRVADGLVDTGRMVDLSLLDLQAEIDTTDANITMPVQMPVVEGDSGEMTRLFQNLIGNALKYRKADQVPRIVVDCADHGGYWEFSIADNGIGIPPEHRERAFGIFQRLHGRHEYEGTGIGLAICRKIVERWGGSIWVEGNAEGGAIFRFTWPKPRRTTLSAPAS